MTTTTAHLASPIRWTLAFCLVFLAMVASASAAIVDPSGISGLRLWLEANDLDGDGIASGAGENYISGSTAIWADKSGQGHHFTQTNAASHASQTLGALNGLATLTFSSTDHFTGPAGVLTAGDDSYTYVAVWNSTGLNGCCGSIYEQGSGGSQRSSMLQIGGNYGFNGEGNDAHIVPNTLNQWKITDLQVNNAVSPNVEIYNNGSLFAGNSGSPGALNVATNGTAVGKKVNVNGEYFQGQIAEIIVYDKTLTFQEHSDIGTYLNSKYNLGAAYPLTAPPEGLDTLAHRWSFNDGTMNDSIGPAHGAAENGNVFVSGDQLNITGAGRMLTSAIGNGIGEKTMVVWTTLANESDSTRGSALTLQNNSSGSTFDAIVYGEASAQHWMAGSEGFNRTQNPQLFGFAETLDGPGEVMIAIVYGLDNSITLYRDGDLYGTYSKGSLVNFDANALVQIGRRHGTHADTFLGMINEARIYGDALTADDIALLYSLGPNQLAQLVPEPTSIIMLALGVVGLACLLRNRRFHGKR